MSLDDWKETLVGLHPKVKFSYNVHVHGGWAALIGDSPATDLVGVYTALGNSSVAEGALRVKLDEMRGL